jgi:hypothetical protein
MQSHRVDRRDEPGNGGRPSEARNALKNFNAEEFCRFWTQQFQGLGKAHYFAGDLREAAKKFGNKKSALGRLVTL